MANEFPTPIEEITKKVMAYHTKMNAIADFLVANSAPAELRIDKSREYMEFYIDKAGLARLNEMASQPGCQSLVVFLGLADYVADSEGNIMTGGHSVTGCMLAIDKDKEILDEHFGKRREKIDPMMGEDTWLPPGGTKIAGKYQPSPKDFTLATPAGELKKHFLRELFIK